VETQIKDGYVGAKVLEDSFVSWLHWVQSREGDHTVFTVLLPAVTPDPAWVTPGTR